MKAIHAVADIAFVGALTWYGMSGMGAPSWACLLVVVVMALLGASIYREGR